LEQVFPTGVAAGLAAAMGGGCPALRLALLAVGFCFDLSHCYLGFSVVFLVSFSLGCPVLGLIVLGLPLMWF
jgi:hypothetical protein